MSNIRDSLNFQKSYYEINREERNLTAILYHLLCIESNLRLFLEILNIPESYNYFETEIYYEYAFLRDL